MCGRMVPISTATHSALLPMKKTSRQQAVTPRFGCSPLPIPVAAPVPARLVGAIEGS
jgi:hypothetical protein